MAERALDSTPHDAVIGRDSHFEPTSSKVPAIYERLRPWVVRLLLAGSIALLWSSAPVWVTGIACGVFLLHWVPTHSTATE